MSTPHPIVDLRVLKDLTFTTGVSLIPGAAMAFLFIPLMAGSMSAIPREKMGNATNIYNLMRNLAGSFGIAAITTFLARRSKVPRTSCYRTSLPTTIRQA